MDHKADKFSNHLHAQGLKFTPERRTVLNEVFAIHNHFEAEDLLLQIRQGGHRVSRGTIYRTLALLVECGLVRKVIFTEKHAHYEHVYGHKHHEHLICKGCGLVIEFYQDVLEDSLEETCRGYNFQMESHKVEVLGYCKDCSAKKR